MRADSTFLFNAIAPVYGLFFKKQKARYTAAMDRVSDELDIGSCDTVLDVGCGTGALCSVLSAKGLRVTGAEPAGRMLGIAKRQQGNKDVTFIQASVLDRLPFDDKAFDISIASYVAHGLQKVDRARMYVEMCRVTKYRVAIYDYNQSRTPLTSLIEWLERGDYFNFIKDARSEMEQCTAGTGKCFSAVKVIDIDRNAALYVCTPAG